jgi:Tol biopolymer transport system component
MDRRHALWIGLSVLVTLLAESAAAERPGTAPADVSSDAEKALANEVHDKGWIACSARSEKGDWDLFLMRPDGSQVRNVTNTPEFSEAAPRFSNDGRHLLYRRLERDARIEHDRWGFQGRVVIADPDGRNPQVIGDDREFPWATWSPDDRQIACLTLKGIQFIDLATKEVVREMPRKGMYQQLAWSPDGKWLCGVSNHLGKMWTVARMDARSGEINAVNSFQNCTPDWLPDSKRIIFSHRPGNQDGYGWTQLWLADGDGSNRRMLYGRDGRHIYGGATSPDMKYVLFSASKADGGESEKDGAPMHLMRMPDKPVIQGESPDLRKVHPDSIDAPVLTLPVGWEPHWTYAKIAAGDDGTRATKGDGGNP